MHCEKSTEEISLERGAKAEKMLNEPKEQEEAVRETSTKESYDAEENWARHDTSTGSQ